MEKIIKFLPTEDLEIKSIDEKKRIIWHKITKEVTDRLGDIVRIDGIDLKQFKKKPAVLYGHDYIGGKPVPVIAEGIGFKREGKALYAGTKFHDTSTDEMSQALKDLVNDNWFLHKKKLLGWSIGFIAKNKEELKDKEGGFAGYDFKETELLEYSSVVIPAHQDAIDDAFKQGQISQTFIKSMEVYKGNFDYQNFYDNSTRLEDELSGEIAERMIEEIEMKPYPNEHACRLNEPGKYEKFRRGKRKHEGKEYSIIFGKLKGKDKWEEQAYRYDKDIWTAVEARKHCKDHDGAFEAASGKECLDCQNYNDPQLQGIMPNLINALHKIVEMLHDTQKTIAEYLRNLTGGNHNE